MTQSRKKKERCKGQRDKTDKMVTSQKIRNFPSELTQKNTKYTKMRECQICASPPSHLSWCIFSEATLCGSSVKAAVVGVCQIKTVDCIFCSIPPARPSVLCHYWDVSRNRGKKKKTLKIISFYSPHHWLQLLSNRFYPANTVRVCQCWYVMIGQSVVGCLSVVRICVWPVVI